MREEKSVGKNREIIDHLPMLKCECGAEILLLPDLKKMSYAIKVHFAEHRKNVKTPPKPQQNVNELKTP